MLLSDWILSKRNEGLTLKAAKWVIANALSIPPQQLTEICRQADHPLLQDETLFDDVPNEARALFVTTPLLPRKYFNSAFAWLFGKNSIHEIDASCLATYESLLSQHLEYSIDQKWDKIQFTKDEYDHVYSAFYVTGQVYTGTTLGRCLHGLHLHHHISAETFIRLIAQDSRPSLNENASEEVAKVLFDNNFYKAKKKFNHKSSGTKAGFFLSSMSEPIKLKNLSQDRPNMAIAKFGLENFEHKEVFRLYNGKIPDSIMTKMFELDIISIKSIAQHKDLIVDERIPLEMASEAVRYCNDVLCAGYLKRGDVTKNMRLELLSEIRAKNQSEGKLTYTYKNIMTDLIENGVLTLSEIEHFECDELRKYDDNSIFKWSIKTGNELSVAMQNRWIDLCVVCKRFSKEQLQLYWDVPKIVKLITEHYIESPKPYSPLGSQYEESKHVIPYLFQNKGWTDELLLELLKICNREPASAHCKGDLNDLSTGALCKLFSESIYPALTDHPHRDGESKYGRTEKALAYLLHSNYDLLSPCDIDLLIQSNIQFDYKDDDVDLGQVMQMHPDLNEAAIAQQLKRRLGKFGDMPASPRTSHHI